MDSEKNNTTQSSNFSQILARKETVEYVIKSIDITQQMKLATENSNLVSMTVALQQYVKINNKVKPVKTKIYQPGTMWNLWFISKDYVASLNSLADLKKIFPNFILLDPILLTIDSTSTSRIIMHIKYWSKVYPPQMLQDVIRYGVANKIDLPNYYWIIPLYYIYNPKKKNTISDDENITFSCIGFSTELLYRYNIYQRIALKGYVFGNQVIQVGDLSPESTTYSTGFIADRINRSIATAESENYQQQVLDFIKLLQKQEEDIETEGGKHV